MQLAESKLYIASLTPVNLAPAGVPSSGVVAASLAAPSIAFSGAEGANDAPFGLGRTGFIAGCRSEHKLRTVGGRASGHKQTGCNLMADLRKIGAAERLLALMLAAFVVTASPAILATVRTTVAIALQIFVQVGHLGFTAFQIFGR
jgi:hypothetical protein